MNMSPERALQMRDSGTLESELLGSACEEHVSFHSPDIRHLPRPRESLTIL